MITIAQMLQISWEPCLKDILNGNTFYDKRLSILLRNGDIAVGDPLDSVDPAGAIFSVKSNNLPMVWNTNFDKRTEAEKIDLVARMIKSGIQSHDASLLMRVKEKGFLIVSAQHQYVLSQPYSIISDIVAADVQSVYYSLKGLDFSSEV